MKNLHKYLILCTLLLCIFSCKQTKEEAVEVEEKRQVIEMVTTKGTMLIELYNETPKHRDNFIKITNDGVLDSLLFHRVIETFMVQGGDPESKNAQPEQRLGSGDLGYKVDAEFRPNLFHKKGALAAARDGNLQRASSASQFYIVQGEVYTDSTLIHDEGRINEWLAQHYFKNDPVNKALMDSFQSAIDNKNWNKYRALNDSINSLAEGYTNFERYTIPQEHRELYKTIGGTAHLDQNYTVFGEVIEGLEVVDSIAAVIVDQNNRPFYDVRIISVKVKSEN
ncbi:peptidylprolyl isomerase [Flavobacteriaceae sp. LMIT009]